MTIRSGGTGTISFIVCVYFADLEEALTALTRPHSVVLAGSVVSADGTQQRGVVGSLHQAVRRLDIHRGKLVTVRTANCGRNRILRNTPKQQLTVM